MIWLPFDTKESAYYIRLKELGFKIIQSHINEGKDFFEYQPEQWDVILSNPPFSKKDKVLKRLYELEKKFAVLLPLNSLQGKSRYECFKQGIQLLSFDGRISYHSKIDLSDETKGSPFASAYFYRGLLPKDLIVEKLNKG